MPVNIVLLVKDRPRITEQTLRTLYENTPEDQFNVVCIDDGSYVQTAQLLADWCIRHPNMRGIRLSASIGIVGWLRNIGASASERYFGRGEWLYFSDCDVAFFPNWLPHMIHAMKLNPEVKILGGCRHPYHGVNMQLPMGNGRSVALTDAVAGYSLMMRWSCYDEFGPFASNQKGVGASEDYAMARKIVEAGWRVGYIEEPVLTHTGISNTDGKPATGHESFHRFPGVAYE